MTDLSWADFGGWEIVGVWYRKLTDAEFECLPSTTEVCCPVDGWRVTDFMHSVASYARDRYRIPADQGVGIGYRLPTERERREGLPEETEFRDASNERPWFRASRDPQAIDDLLTQAKGMGVQLNYRIPLPRVPETQEQKLVEARARFKAAVEKKRNDRRPILGVTHWECEDCGKLNVCAADYCECGNGYLDATRVNAPEKLDSSKMCGCRHHTIEPGADPYAAHREWLEENRKTEAMLFGWLRFVPGIGASKPESEVGMQLQDWDGDGI